MAGATENKKSQLAPLVGMGVGVLLVLIEFMGFDSFNVNNPNIVAEVNGRPILLEDYETLIEMLAADKRNPVTDEDKAFALQRMIDEELLIQKGVALGLVEGDVAVRKAISAAMISVIKLDGMHSEPTRAELEIFYAENIHKFVQPDQYLVRRFVGETPEDALKHARAGVGGQDDPVNPIPPLPLSPKVLLNYIGPSALNAVLGLKGKGLTLPMKWGEKYQVIEVTAAQVGSAPPFDILEEAVIFEFKRVRDEKALASYLIRLRNEADIKLKLEQLK